MSSYSDYKSGAIEDWQYRQACERENSDYNYNPCKNCPNYEIEEDEAGKYAYCLLGETHCDREEGNE